MCFTSCHGDFENTNLRKFGVAAGRRVVSFNHNPALMPAMVKLSILTTIGALVANAVSCASAESNFGRRTFVLPRKNSNQVNANAAALSIRGGGQYEDIAKKAYYVLMASQGLPTALAPEKTGDILFNGAFTVEEDSLSSFLVGYAGSSCECSHYMLFI